MTGMADEWFYAQHGRQLGPVPIETLLAMLGNRQVAPTDLVWKQGMPNWAEARAIPELSAPVSAPAPIYAPVAPLIGSPQPQPQAHATPGVYQMQYLTPQHVQLDYAGFWLRFCAWFIDSLILFIPSFLMSFGMRVATSIPGARPTWSAPMAIAMGGSHNLLAIIIWWLYYALMESSPRQATLGKMALGLIVTDELGNRLTFARATGRTFAKYVSWLILGIGYIMAGFTDKKQGLHDIIARSLVLRKDTNRPGM